MGKMTPLICFTFAKVRSLLDNSRQQRVERLYRLSKSKRCKLSRKQRVVANKLNSCLLLPFRFRNYATIQARWNNLLILLVTQHFVEFQ